MKSLYDVDFVEWSARNAGLLRERRFTEADIHNIADEVEDLGKQWRRALDSHMMQLLMHLLKLQAQPDYLGVRGWKGTIASQRIEIRRLLAKAPSLDRQLGDNLDDNYRDAVTLAAAETGLPASAFPDRCPWPLKQILNEDFLPQ